MDKISAVLFFATKKMINKKDGGKMVVFDTVLPGGVMTKIFSDDEKVISGYEKIKVPGQVVTEFNFSEYNGLKINLLSMDLK